MDIPLTVPDTPQSSALPKQMGWVQKLAYDRNTSRHPTLLCPFLQETETSQTTGLKVLTVASSSLETVSTEEFSAEPVVNTLPSTPSSLP